MPATFSVTITNEDTGEKLMRSTKIPARIIEGFIAKSRAYLPEKGDKAPITMLHEFLARMAGGNYHTLIITDIPSDARDKAEGTAKAVGVENGFDEVVMSLLHAALEDRFHMINFAALPDREDVSKQARHWLLMANYPQIGLDVYDRMARDVSDAYAKANIKMPHEKINALVMISGQMEAAANGSIRTASVDQMAKILSDTAAQEGKSGHA
jgi:hypothetical protein